MAFEVFAHGSRLTKARWVWTDHTLGSGNVISLFLFNNQIFSEKK